MDLSNFYRDDRPGEYTVVIDVRATVSETVIAASEADARAQVEAMLEADEIEVYGSDIDEARISYARKSPTMYLVERGGSIMSVSRPEPGDEPREPLSHEARAYKPIPANPTPEPGE